MTDPTLTNDTQAPTAPKAPASGELTFPEYEARRRAGKSIEASAAPSAPEAKAPAQKPAVKSDATDDEQDEHSEDSAKDLGDHSEDEADDSDKDKPRKKGGFQRRIDKLNARISERDKELEYWRSQVMKNGKEDAPKEPVAAKQVPAQADDGKPNPERFDTHAEYVEALADWKLDQRERVKEEKTKAEQARAEQAKVLQSHSERVRAFAERTTDFLDMMENLDDVHVSPELQKLIVESDHSAALLYELAKNKAEAVRIAKLSPTAAARELGKMESRLESQSSSSVEDKKPETNKVTKAPKPLDPVTSGSAKVMKKSITDPDLSFAEYERIRREQKRRR